MYHIEVWNEKDLWIGWVDAKNKLTLEKNKRASFISEEAADKVCAVLEEANRSWNMKVVE